MLGERLWLACLVVLSLSSAAALADTAPDWRFVARDRGVLVTTRTEPGHGHPTFRGEAKLEASALHVLAVVLDTPNATRWARGADHVEVLQKQPGRTELLRMVTDLPWPIRDREMVMERSVSVIEPGKVFDVRFACASARRPEQKSYVRVRECDSHFLIKALDAGHTYVDYRAYVDPGGGLPSWSVRWMEKRVAVDTLHRLGRQVGNTAGKYQAEMALWASAR